MPCCQTILARDDAVGMIERRTAMTAVRVVGSQTYWHRVRGGCAMSRATEALQGEVSCAPSERCATPYPYFYVRPQMRTQLSQDERSHSSKAGYESYRHRRAVSGQM